MLDFSDATRRICRAAAVVALALLHGAGNAMIAIAKGTLPPVLFGTVGYGLLQGWLASRRAPFRRSRLTLSAWRSTGQAGKRR